MSRHQNPTGISIGPQRQRGLLSLARRFGLLLVEDDVFFPLQYGGPHIAPLKARDKMEQVIYVDSFSKVLMPGLRIGYMVPPPSLRPHLLRSLQVGTLGSPALLQRALAEFLHGGLFEEHLARVVPRYRERRDAMLEALGRSMPDGVKWTRPEGGLCCWIELPEGGAFEDLYQASLAQGIIYTPAEAFLPQPTGRTCLRLSFGAEKPRDIRRAVEGFARLVRQRLARPRAAAGADRRVQTLV